MDLTKVVDFQAAGQRHGTGRRQSHGGDRQPRGPFQDRLRLREALFHLTLTGLSRRYRPRAALISQVGSRAELVLTCVAQSGHLPAETARTSTSFTIFEGTSEIQRMIIGRAVTGLDVR